MPQKDAMAIVSFRHTSSALLLGALLGLLSSWPLTTPADPPAAVIAHQVMQVVEGRYVEEVDGPKWLLEGLDQALSQLDRHSRFFPPAEATRFEQETGGILFGIGIIMKKNENGGATIDKVLPDGPAQLAGILAGDQIISIEGDRTEDWELAQISARIRGILDTEVSLGLLRNGTELQVTARRAEVQIPSITESTLFTAADRSTTTVGLIRLQQFQPESSSRLQQAVQKMVASGAEGVILDLRNNGGGLLHEAVKIVSLFLQEGQTVVSTRGRSGSGDHQV
ncbi:MAG: S41 family peptidase, partial [bacterium]